MNRQFDNLTSGFYQLSHATIAPVIGHLHLTTECIVSDDMHFVKRYFEEKLPRIVGLQYILDIEKKE